MSNWTGQQYLDYVNRTNSSKNKRTRPYTGIEERKDVGITEREKTIPNDKAKSPKMDGGGYRGFAISVTLLVSDKRIRDGSGCLCTIEDCLVKSSRRLAGVDSKRGFSVATVLEG